MIAVKASITMLIPFYVHLHIQESLPQSEIKTQLYLFLPSALFEKFINFPLSSSNEHV